MKEKLKKLVDQSLPEILKVLELQDLDPQTVAYDIDLPKIKAHGDLSINLAFHLARRLKKNPYDVAAACQNEIQKKVHADKSLQTWVQKISVERPGFINFKLTGDSLASQLLEIARLDRAFGLSKVGHGTKALIEFVSANPTGPLTIAHGRQAAIGDALARILKAVGYEVHKEFYLNDSGRQIRLLGQSLWVRYQELFGRKVSIPEEGYQGAYLIETAKSLRKDKGDALLKLEEAKVIELTSLYAIHSILEGIKKDLADARVMFDEYFSESTLYKQNQIEPILGVLNKKGFSYEADDALWFRSTQFGDDKDRVLRKKTGEYTYLAPDIAYHRNKFERGFKI
ncbi:MAG: arginine--tRNA ligase, partial [Candidatus Omnitrophica bacterium]|nr:arginine--tRNA ligase [Candidatus Omnitrophota bacterium]